MRKALKFLLLAVMLLVMVGMTMMVASAEGEAADSFEVFSGETSHGTFATFADAMAAVKTNSADTIKVLANVTLSETMLIDTPVTIDGQGHTITFPVDFYGDSSNWKYAVQLATTGEATLTDIVIDVLGGSHMDGDTTVWDFITAIGITSTGTLKIDNAEVKGGYYLLKTVQAGKLVVDGENSKLGLSHRSNFWSVEAPATLELKAGLIDTTNNGSDALNFSANGKGANFVMSGGTYKTGGDAFYSSQPYNITVTGGTITAKGSAVNPKGNGTIAKLSNCVIECGTGKSAINCRGTGTEFTLTNVTLTGLMNTDGSGKMTIESGTYTAHINNYLVNWNNSGATLHIKGGTFTAPENTTAAVIRISDGGATVTIDGGIFSLTTAHTSTVNLVEKKNGKLTINNGTFTANGNAQCIGISQDAATSYTTINNGMFTANSSADVVYATLSSVAANSAPVLTVNGGTFIAQGNSGCVFSIGANGVNATGHTKALITGGDFVAKNYRYGLRLYGSAGAEVEITGGYFSYIEREYALNDDGTMKAGYDLKNSNGNTACAGTLFMNCASDVTISGGIFFGGDSNHNIRLNRADNLILDGNAEFYGYRNFDLTCSSGKVCITMYGAKLGNVLGQVNRYDFISHDVGVDEYYRQSFIKIYGGEIAPLNTASGTAFINVNKPFSVEIGGTYVKGGQTYTADVDLTLQGKAYGVYVGIDGANITFGAGATITKDGSNNILEMNNVNSNVTVNEGAKLTTISGATTLWMNKGTLTVNGGIIRSAGAHISASGGTVVLNGGVFQSAHNNTPMSFSGSVNVTFNEGVFQTYLDTITSPDQIDPEATTIPRREGLGAGATAADDQKLRTQGISINTTGEVVFNGGFYQGGSEANQAVVIYSKVTINGGTFMGYRALRLYAGADVTIEGGNFYGGNAVANTHLIVFDGEGAKLTVNGGTFSTEYNVTNAFQKGAGMFMVNQKATLAINGGTFIGDIYSSDTTGVAMVNVTSTAGADVTITGGTFTSDGADMFALASGTLTVSGGTFTSNGADMFALVSGTLTITGGTFTSSGGDLFALVSGTLTVSGGTFTVQNGGAVVNSMTGVTFVAGGTTAFVIGQGSVLPSEEMDTNYQYENAYWTVKSWDMFTVSTAFTVNSFAEFRQILAAYVEDQISNELGYMNIVPGTNCTIDITEWVPVVVVEGGDLTVNLAEALTVCGTMITVNGGKVTVLGGTYVGAYFGNNLNGIFNVMAGELVLENGSFTMTNGGSIVYMMPGANASVTIKDGTYLIDNAGANYHQGSVVRIGAWTDPVYGTVTILGGNFTATRVVSIYAANVDGEGNALEGVTVNVTGGTYHSNALKNVATDNRYLFQIARDGYHTINVSNATITGTAYGILFIANASGNHATFNLDKVNVSGGLAWFYSNKHNVVFNVTNSTFTDTTGEMGGHRGALIGVEQDGGAFEMKFTNVTFNVTSNIALFAPWSAGGTTTLENVTATVAKFLYPNSKGTFNVDGLLLVITGEVDTVFHVANPGITEAVVIANATYIISGVEFGAAKVLKGGVAYGAYIKVPATDANYTTTQEPGAAIDVTSQFIATNPEKGGIRFLSTISQEVADTLLSDYAGATFSFGTLIAPADYVVAAGAFTMEALDKLQVSGVKYVDIPAVDTFDDANGDGIPESFSGALISLKSYTRAYAGISYIKITYVGETTYLYGEFDSAINARSAKQVADAMIADGNSAYNNEYSPEQKAVVDAYAGKVSE